MKAVGITVKDTVGLQQYLPFTVLKRINVLSLHDFELYRVATVLTVYGIETLYFR